MDRIKLEAGWKSILGDFLKSPRMAELKKFLIQEIDQGKIIFPPPKDIFNAFNNCPWEKVKVVIIGQDPYHGQGQAHGLSFSVKPGIKPPPSLVNIFKELKSDLGIIPPTSGHLMAWAHQGVLLINSVLTVEAQAPGSHRKKGWEEFSDFVVEKLNQEKSNLVFILWGKDAQIKGQKIDRRKHFVIEAAHPSPFSAHKFFGHRPFSRTNKFLKEHGKLEINWNL